MIGTSFKNEHPRLNCEHLESRENPAGNVSVAIVGGQLIVAGDALDNAVSTQRDQMGNVVVIGVDGTTVNGQAAVNLGPFVPVDAIFDGGAGNDQIDVAGLFISRQLSVAGGTGNDLITIRGTNSEFVSVTTGTENDTLITTNVVARMGAEFHGGAGYDIWDFNGVFAGSYFFHDGFESIV